MHLFHPNLLHGIYILRIYQEPNNKLNFVIKNRVPNWYKIILAIVMISILIIWITINTLMHTQSITLDGKIIRWNQALHAVVILPPKFIHFAEAGNKIVLHPNVYPKTNATLNSIVYQIEYSYGNKLQRYLDTKNSYVLISQSLPSDNNIKEGILIKAVLKGQKRYIIDWLIE